MEVKYLNTDLEIESNQDLSSMVEELGEDVFVLHNGIIRGYHFASFEVPGGLSLGADEAIDYLCNIVENLKPKSREIWDKCVSRVFDIGFESGDSSNNYRVELRQSTIQSVAKINASIAITIYPADTK
jgi:hypothetical protein